MEQLGALPSAEVVLDKLKSDGTFDQFRKTCSAAIEAEPSFRAHGEHLEVLSRRYLQDFNWRESTTRNEVRSKLRQHVLGVIARGPELHVGMPLAAILEKTLESKANDLLPQIMDTVESLRALKPQQGSQSDSGNAHSLTGSQATPSGSTSSTTTEPTATSTSSKKELGTLDLGLPIDIIPGLGAPPKKEPVGGGGEGRTTKSKLKQNDGAILKEGVKGPARPKMVVTSGNKGTAAVKEGAKEKEKEDSKGAVEKESEIVTGKEKMKISCKPKNPKEESKEKTAAGQNKESSEKPQDKATVKPHTGGGGKEKDKPGDAKKGRKKDESEGEPSKTELKSEQKEVSKGGVPKGGCKETEGQLATPAEKEPQETDTGGGSSRRKQHTPTRRSARIASISESKDQSKQKESETEGEENSSSRQESDGSEGDAGVERKQVKQQRRRRRKRPRETDKAPSSSRKKARVLLSSSSEESEREESEADLEKVEESYKSESEAKEEEEKPSKMVKGKGRERRKPRVHEAPQRQPRRSRKRGRPPSQKEDTESQGQPKRSKMVAGSKQSSATLLKKQFKLKLHRFSSPPMVKTRYNRLVKPNRKYSPAGELSNLESEENSEEQKQDEGEEEEEEKKEEEEGEEAASESVEGENTSEEELSPKPAKVASTYRRTKKMN